MARKKSAPRGITLAEKLSFYSIPEPNSGCFLWMGAANNKGYGVFKWAGRLRLAHRLAWEVVNGPVPDGKCVLHRCDNPACVNPRHLWADTIAANNADKAAKGRGRGGVSLGERHGLAKLTADDVRAIRAAVGVQRIIAAQFGVSHQVVSAVRARRIWKHVT